jgi:hypothetical protein
MTDAILHDDIYEVVKVNPDGKKFERVNRLVCKGQTYETDLVLDIASEVYSLREGEKFTFAIASTLRLDGKPDEDTYNQDGKVRTARRRVRVCARALFYARWWWSARGDGPR